MWIDFEQMRDDDTVWVFQASRVLTEAENRFLLEKITQFCQNWESHGTPVHASVAARHHRWFVIAADGQMMPSGCSMDKLTHLMQHLGNELNINFLDRTRVVYWKEKDMQEVHFHEIEALIKQGVIAHDTPVADMTASNVRTIKQAWPAKAADTWLKRYF